MKKIEAIIRHFKLDELKAALSSRVISGMTITEVRGFGRQKGHADVYRGNEYKVDFVPKVKVEIVVPTNYLPTVLEIVTSTARTGQTGDGKIFITDLSSVVRIRTGELDENAI